MLFPSGKSINNLTCIAHLTAVSIIHPDASSLVFFTVNGFYHLAGRVTVYLYPAVHFLHIYSAQYFFFQLTHVQYKLQEAGFIKTILSTQVYKQAHVITTIAITVTVAV